MIKIDLHVHSRYSKRPSQWILQKTGCPESFSEPLWIYQSAKAKGMTHITITDHNRIDGALEIAHLPGTFISEEVTTYFPEDGCKIHILAWGINEKQHEDIQKVRKNIYEFAGYLKQEEICHAVAHPLYGPDDRLLPEHFEKMLLLFKSFELNGACGSMQNNLLKMLLEWFDPEDISRLSEKHGIVPDIVDPHKKYLTGGSDDHGGFNIGRTCTVIETGSGMYDLFAGIRNGRTKVLENPSTPLTTAHDLYGIAYQFYRDKFNLEKAVAGDVLLKFLDRSLRPGNDEQADGLMAKIYCYWRSRKNKNPKPDLSDGFVEIIRRETRKWIEDNPGLLNDDKTGNDALEEEWYEFVRNASDKILMSFFEHLPDHFSGAKVFNIFHGLGSAGGLYTLLAPYFVSFSQFSQKRSFNERICRHFNP